MFKILQKNGFASFVEVIVTAIIFFAAAVGIITTTGILRLDGQSSAHKLKAAYAGKQVLDNMRALVRADIWDDISGPLAAGTVQTRTVGNFIVNVTITAVPGMDLRRLDVEVFAAPGTGPASIY